MSVLVLGTVALDEVKTPFGARRRMLGGSAVHFSMSARLFTPVHLAAVVGEDFPSRYVAFLRRQGINLDSLLRSPGSTFHWEGKYVGDLSSAITLKTQLGVLANFSPRLTRQQKAIRQVFLANVDPHIQTRFLGMISSPQLVGLDSMNYWIHSQRNCLLRLLKKVTVYVANDQEARDLSREGNLIKAAQALCALGPRMVLVKKGEHGAFLYSKQFMINIPAYPTQKVVDPTGAGDTFAGAFMGYLAKRNKINQASVKSAIVWATVAASFNVEAFGVEATSKLTRKDLEKRRQRFEEISAF